MRITAYIIVCLSLCMIACEKDALREITDNSTQEDDIKLLEELYREIILMVSEEECTDASQWNYTAIGAKACGGPVGYIAYPLSIDVDKFLDMVEHYSVQQDRYNKKWGIISTCDVPPMPAGIECRNGDPVFTY